MSPRPAARPAADEPDFSDADLLELDILSDQLKRMRGMLFGYSERFFDTIRNWAFLSLGLLGLEMGGVLPGVGALVAFIVPFAFLETGYLFWYTIFARRHAERLEMAINERFGRDVLVAHRLEAAYFYPPDAPKVAALSFGNPFGFMSAATVGYTLGAVILWGAGFLSLQRWAAGAGTELAGLLVPLALAWTAAITLYLLWTFLRRPDERRFLAVLERSYRRS